MSFATVAFVGAVPSGAPPCQPVLIAVSIVPLCPPRQGFGQTMALTGRAAAKSTQESDPRPQNSVAGREHGGVPCAGLPTRSQILLHRFEALSRCAFQRGLELGARNDRAKRVAYRMCQRRHCRRAERGAGAVDACFCAGMLTERLRTNLGQTIVVRRRLKCGSLSAASRSEIRRSLALAMVSRAFFDMLALHLLTPASRCANRSTRLHPERLKNYSQTSRFIRLSH